ncbi:MAG: hypothetical protein WBQ73_02480, partial [Candidatus Babeliales bacterium]
PHLLTPYPYLIPHLLHLPYVYPLSFLVFLFYRESPITKGTPLSCTPPLQLLAPCTTLPALFSRSRKPPSTQAHPREKEGGSTTEL